MVSERSECTLCIGFDIYALDAKKGDDGGDGGAAGIGGNPGTYSIVAFEQTPMFTISQERGIF